MKNKTNSKKSGNTRFHRFICFTFGGIVRLIFRMRVIGRENEPEQGGFLVCSNHISAADPIIITAAMDHQVCFMGKKELFKIPFLSWLMRSLGGFPVDRKGGDVGAVKHSIRLLEDGKCARTCELTEDELVHLSDTPLLTMKPVIYVANVSEDDAGGDPADNAMYEALKVHAASEGAEVIAICAGIEAEIAELSGEEKQMFLDDLGIPESGLDRLIKKSYALLGLISYLTAGPEEVRAWTIVKGTKAPQAAGKIHSDFERGFIRAEVVAFEDLERLGSMNAVREAGLYRSEGKDYVMKDGDIVLYRFNV